MKKLILILALFCPLLLFGQAGSTTTDFSLNALSLGGYGLGHFLDTTSVGQIKNGTLTVKTLTVNDSILVLFINVSDSINSPYANITDSIDVPYIDVADSIDVVYISADSIGDIVKFIFNDATEQTTAGIAPVTVRDTVIAIGQEQWSIQYADTSRYSYDSDSLNGQIDTYYLNTSSTAQTKTGILQLDSLLRFDNDSSYIFLNSDKLYIVHSNDTVAVLSGGQLILDPQNSGTEPELVFGGSGDNEGIDNRGLNNIYFYINGVSTWAMTGGEFGSGGAGTLRLNQVTASRTVLGAYYNGDANTGLNHWGADSIGFVAGGVHGLNVGEGGGFTVTTVFDTLKVESDSGIVSMFVSDTIYIQSSGTIERPIKIGNGSIIIDTSGDVYIDSLTVNEKIYYEPSHAWMRFSDTSYTLVLSQNNWCIVSDTGRADSLFIKSEFSSLTYSGDTIVVNTYGGDYEGIYALDFTGANNNVYELRVMHNGSQIVKRRIPFGANIAEGGTSIPFYIQDVNVGDQIWLEIRNTANNNDVILKDGSLLIKLLHP